MSKETKVIPVKVLFKGRDNNTKEIIVPFGMLSGFEKEFDFYITRNENFSKCGILTAIYSEDNGHSAIKEGELQEFLENYDEATYATHIKEMTEEELLFYKHLSKHNYRFTWVLKMARFDLMLPLLVDFPVMVYVNGEVRDMVDVNGRFTASANPSTHRNIYTGIHESRPIVLLVPPTIEPPENFTKMHIFTDVLYYIDSYSDGGVDLSKYLSKKEPVVENTSESPIRVSFVSDAYIVDVHLEHKMAYVYNNRVYPVTAFSEDNFSPTHPLEEFLLDFYQNGLIEVSPSVLVTFREAMKDDHLVKKAREIIAAYFGTNPVYLNLSKPTPSIDNTKDNGLKNYYLQQRHRPR